MENQKTMIASAPNTAPKSSQNKIINQKRARNPPQKIVCTATICHNDPKGDRRTGERKCAYCSSKRYLTR